MINTKNLSIGYFYSSKKRSSNILHHDINISLSRGELICLLGENGAGKSTLIKTLSGFIPTVCGNVFFDGIDLKTMTYKGISQKVGVVQSTAPDLENITVLQVICMGRYPYTSSFGSLSKEDNLIVEDAVRIINIERLTNKYFNFLSDGEKQKVMITKCIAQQTPHIIMDEPMAFLDYPSRIEMMNILKTLARNHNKSILLSTHNIEMALDLADKLWIMNTKGEFIETTTQQLKGSTIIEQFFNKETQNWINRFYFNNL